MRNVIANVLAITVGTVLLCYGLGWQIGLGIGLLVYFHKEPE